MPSRSQLEQKSHSSDSTNGDSVALDRFDAYLSLGTLNRHDWSLMRQQLDQMGDATRYLAMQHLAQAMTEDRLRLEADVALD